MLAFIAGSQYLLTMAFNKQSVGNVFGTKEDTPRTLFDNSLGDFISDLASTESATSMAQSTFAADIAIGKWVDAPKKQPYYSSGPCIEGRDARTPWKKQWVPDAKHVQFKPLDARKLNECLSNGTVHIAGDSHYYQQGLAMQSFCKRRGCTFRVKAYKDHFLKKVTSAQVLRQMKKRDVLVLGYGHHFKEEGSMGKAWESEARSSVKQRIKNVLNSFRGRAVVWQSYTPRHFYGGEWNTGGSCAVDATINYTRSVPKSEKKYLKVWRSILLNVADEIARFKMQHRTNFDFIISDITEMSLQRPDAHAFTFFGGWDKHPCDKNKKKRFHGTRCVGRIDCSHYCFPGLPDEWNAMWYNLLCESSSVG